VIIIRSDDYYYEPSILGVSGSAHAVSSDAEQEDETIRRLHEVVKEVTGKAVEQPVKQRIGFLP
jgi:hypothetical protein